LAAELRDDIDAAQCCPHAVEQRPAGNDGQSTEARKRSMYGQSKIALLRTCRFDENGILPNIGDTLPTQNITVQCQ